MRVTGMLLVAVCGTSAALTAQSGASSPVHPPRTGTVTAGLGNSLGWLGIRGELYQRGDRVSLFAGLGMTPSFEPGDPTGATFAAGIRGYTPGLRHRGFVELSFSQIGIESTWSGIGGRSGTRRYGPGAQVGYQFAALGGFTMDLSAGAGYAPGISEGLDRWQALIGAGLGYTFR